MLELWIKSSVILILKSWKLIYLSIPISESIQIAAVSMKAATKDSKDKFLIEIKKLELRKFKNIL